MAATKFNEQGVQNRGAGEASQAQGRVDQGCWPAAGQPLGEPAACHRGLVTLARAEGWVDLGDGVAPGCRGPAGPGRTCCVLGPGKQDPLAWGDGEQVTLRGGGCCAEASPTPRISQESLACRFSELTPGPTVAANKSCDLVR